MSELTQLLNAIQHGDATAAETLMERVYDELRGLAGRQMMRERPGHTLQPTALVHEAWLRLLGDQAPEFKNRAHFFAAAAEAMRRILVESARRRNSLKHGGQLKRVDLEAIDLPSPVPDEELLMLDEALQRLTMLDECAAQVVKLCFFVGLTQEEAARELNLSVSTAERRWSFARAWLFREIQKARHPAP